nr:hypothetical protein [Tanacetum cinerariifolium]
KKQEGSILFGLPGSRQQKFLVLRFFDVKEKHEGIDSKWFLEFFYCPGSRQGVEDLKKVELQGAQVDREAEVFQVSNDDTAVVYTTMYESGVAKELGVAGIQQQNGLVDETNVTLFAKTLVDMLRIFGWLASTKQGMLEPIKVKCIFMGYRKGIVGNKLWRLDDVTSKVVIYRNMGFNESGEYKKTFISSGVGTGSMQFLHGFEFEVEPLGDHTFEVKPRENVDQGAGLQEAAFAVVAVEKIYAHESLTFNNTVACEVISKWKAGLKDDMDARCKVEIWATKGLPDKAKGNILGMEIFRDQSGNTLRVLQSRFYNRKLEYQMVCTRLNITSVDVGMLDKFDRGLQTDVQVFVDFDYAMGRSITVMESRYELRIVASIATCALVKGGSRSEVPAQVEVAAYRY